MIPKTSSKKKGFMTFLVVVFLATACFAIFTVQNKYDSIIQELENQQSQIQKLEKETLSLLKQLTCSHQQDGCQ
jgi:cell division protein FtsL